MKLGPPDDYQWLLGQIIEVYKQGLTCVVQVVSIQLLKTYWPIGQYILEFEQV